MLQFKEYTMKELENPLCIFSKESMIVICYTDDVLIFGKNEKIIDEFKKALKKKYVTKDLGIPRKFFGIRDTWTNSKTIELKQSNLIESLPQMTKWSGVSQREAQLIPKCSMQKAQR